MRAAVFASCIPSSQTAPHVYWELVGALFKSSCTEGCAAGIVVARKLSSSSCKPIYIVLVWRLTAFGSYTRGVANKSILPAYIVLR